MVARAQPRLRDHARSIGRDRPRAVGRPREWPRSAECYHSASRPGAASRPSSASSTDTPRGFDLAHSTRGWTGARTPSAIKRVRQTQRRRAINQPRRTQAKTLVSKALLVATDNAAGVSGTPEEVQAAVQRAVSALDRAAKIGAIHRNAADRRKSRLMIKVNAALGGEGVAAPAKSARQVGKAAAAKQAKARIAAGRATKAKGAQTAAGKARAALARDLALGQRRGTDRGRQQRQPRHDNGRAEDDGRRQAGRRSRRPRQRLRRAPAKATYGQDGRAKAPPPKRLRRRRRPSRPPRRRPSPRPRRAPRRASAAPITDEQSRRASARRLFFGRHERAIYVRRGNEVSGCRRLNRQQALANLHSLPRPEWANPTRFRVSLRSLRRGKDTLSFVTDANGVAAVRALHLVAAP